MKHLSRSPLKWYVPNYVMFMFTSRIYIVERKYSTCPSRESNPGRLIYRQTLYHVALKACFYRKAVEVCYIHIPTTYFPALN